MSTQITKVLNLIPGFEVQVHTNKEEFTTACAEAVASRSYKLTEAVVGKAWDDSEKIVEAGQTAAEVTQEKFKYSQAQVVAALTATRQDTQAALEAAIAEVSNTSVRVADATAVRIGDKYQEKVGAPVSKVTTQIDERRRDTLGSVRARVDAYCAPTTKLEAVIETQPALPEGKPVETPRLRRKPSSASDVIREEAAKAGL